MKNKNFTLKMLAAITMAAMISLSGFAQEEKEQISTLFGSNDDSRISHGGWAGLTFGYTQIKGKDTYLMGARGGWIVNHRITIGLAGSGLISDGKFDLNDYENDTVLAANLAGGYGGLFMEVIIAPLSPIHVTIPIIIGAGGIAYTNNDWSSKNDYYDDNYNIDSDAYFVFEPGIEAEVNLMKFMRFSIGGSYRFTSNVYLLDSSEGMLRGFNGYFSLKFGWF